jgi:hypothetical protein
MLLYNMSAPPRTEVRAEMRRIADRIVIFSLVHALIARGVLEAPDAPEKLPKAKDIQDRPQDDSGGLRDAIRARWRSPGDLFSQIGEPKPLPVEADFLIGWPVGIYADGGHSAPTRKSWPECRRAARAISTSPAATPI